MCDISLRCTIFYVRSKPTGVNYLVDIICVILPLFVNSINVDENITIFCREHVCAFQVGCVRFQSVDENNGINVLLASIYESYF